MQGSFVVSNNDSYAFQQGSLRKALVLKTLVCSLAEARCIGCVCSESCESVHRAWVIHNRNSGTLGKFAFRIFTVLATFLIARATYPSRNPLRKEGFILAHSIKINFIMVGKAMR